MNKQDDSLKTRNAKGIIVTFIMTHTVESVGEPITPY